MQIYTNKYGVKTSKEIDVICLQVQKYLNNGSKSTFAVKNNSLKMNKLRDKFNKITNYGKLVGYSFSDCCA